MTSLIGFSGYFALAGNAHAIAKRKRRAWTKKDIAELKTHSKSRTPVSKISEVMKRTIGALRRKAGIVGIRLGHRR
jgi:hypothetical protein